jgi:hypothetical protein
MKEGTGDGEKKIRHRPDQFAETVNALMYFIS